MSAPQRVLIVYAGRCGTTERAALLLASHFENASVRDLTKTDASPERYDAVIAGSAVYRGLIEPAVRSFLIRYEKTLGSRPLGLFLCHAFTDEAPDIFRENFPQELLSSCVTYDSFGGSFDLASLGFRDRRWMNKHLKERSRLRGSENMLLGLSESSVRIFAERFQNEISL